MLNQKRTNRWLHFSPIVAPDYAGKKLKEQSAALDKRREDLRRAQDAVDGTIEDLRKKAYETENIMHVSDTIADEVGELLKKEIALRTELADLLRELSSQPHLVKSMGERSLALYQKQFGAERSLARYEAVLQELLLPNKP